jgi:hypothetical protein
MDTVYSENGSKSNFFDFFYLGILKEIVEKRGFLKEKDNPKPLYDE